MTLRANCKLISAALAVSALCPTSAQQGWASWYSVASARREGTSGVMANGQPLHDTAYTAATWSFPLGSRLAVRRRRSATATATIYVTVTDRGPSRPLAHGGRLLDLTPAAFRALAPLDQGLVAVHILRVQ